MKTLVLVFLLMVSGVAFSQAVSPLVMGHQASHDSTLATVYFPFKMTGSIPSIKFITVVNYDTTHTVNVIWARAASATKTKVRPILPGKSYSWLLRNVDTCWTAAASGTVHRQIFVDYP